MNKRGGVKLRRLLAKVVRHPKAIEVVGLLLMAFALLLLVSLLSFSPHDPSFFHYRSREGAVRNFGGLVGAHLAGDLLGILGITTFLLPPALFLVGFGLVGRRGPQPRPLRIVGSFLLLLSVCLLMTLLEQDGFLLPFRGEQLGGFLGGAFTRVLRPVLGPFGLYLATLTGLLLFLVLVSQESLIGLIRSLREIFTWLGQGLIRFLQSVRPSVLAKPMKKALVVRQEKPPRERPARITSSEGVQESPREESLAVRRMPKGDKGYEFPPLSLLDSSGPISAGPLDHEREANKRTLEKTLRDFGIEGRVIETQFGPVVTRYEIEPAPGIKVNRIVGLADDLALSLKALSVRIIAPVPGKAAVGVEIPNKSRAVVHLRDVLTAEAFEKCQSCLPIALGKDTSGDPYITDLLQMPHLLIAGATGSGKSVCIHSTILSFLYRSTPRDVRLLLIDPKRVELSVYNGIPHLVDNPFSPDTDGKEKACQVITDAKQAAKCLQLIVKHMEERYKLFAEVGARSIDAYNRLRPEGKPQLAYLVVIIDELADLMLLESSVVENAVARLAQMARAVGVHLVLATQRPSVDVITGVIKANFPARISFQVSSKVDSRTILDMNGAEQLLGGGDMLFLPPVSSKPTRIHGCYVSDQEISRVVKFLTNRDALEAFPWSLQVSEDRVSQEVEINDEDEALYREAERMVRQTGQPSISLLQRRLRIGFNRAGRMIDRMEREGIVSRPDSRGHRVILKPWSPQG
ncbi:MAG: DNA translocase FtsK 4TM domain-containing protein [Candidatus Methylomirabilales bacterium]